MKKWQILLLIVVLCLSIVTVYSYDNVKTEEYFDKVLGIATFLFAVYFGFSLANTYKRLDRIREEDSKERAAITSIYNISYFMKSPDRKKIKDAMDQYLMATLDYKIEDYIMTTDSFRKLLACIGEISQKYLSTRSKDAEMIKTISVGMQNSRSQTLGLIEEKMSFSQWFILLMLSVIVIGSIIILSPVSIISLIITTTFIAAIVLLLITLYNLDNLSWKQEERIIEPYQQTFESIDGERYYPYDMITSGMVKKHKGKTYRQAHYTNPYPDVSSKRIILIKP